MASPSPARPARAFDFDYRSPAKVEESPLPCGPGCSDKLEEVCAASQRRVASWRKERAQGLNVAAQQGLQDILREEDVLYDLQADLVAVQELTEAARRFRGDGAKLGEVVLQSMRAAGDRAEVVAGTKEVLQSAHEEFQKEVRDEGKKLKQKREAADAQQLDINDFLSRYSRSLGLEITRVSSQTVQLTFTLIDKAELGREFSLVLGLGKEGYVASACSPEVPELPELVERLNEASPSAAAIPMFICGLRRAFAAAV